MDINVCERSVSICSSREHGIEFKDCRQKSSVRVSLGAHLFLTFINDLPKVWVNSKTTLYADDCSLVSTKQIAKINKSKQFRKFLNLAD